MLSNTEDTTPRPNVDTAVAGGNSSTGIIDAINTSDSKNTLPVTAAGTTFQSGRRHGVTSRITPMTVAPL
jgi:hypothetical protein